MDRHVIFLNLKFYLDIYLDVAAGPWNKIREGDFPNSIVQQPLKKMTDI